MDHLLCRLDMEVSHLESPRRKRNRLDRAMVKTSDPKV